MVNRLYTKPGRLSDVLALIQVLALDEDTHRSESGISRELQGAPSSSNSWIAVAQDHPEFFRVATQGEHALSLVARHVVAKDERGVHVLPSDFTYRLLQTAIDLHDREVSRAERWKAFMPLWTALAATILTLFATLATQWLTHQSSAHQNENLRFKQFATEEEFAFDTKSGQVCIAWPEIMKDNPHKIPVCRDLR